MSIIFSLYSIIKGYAMNNITMENNLYILFFVSLLYEPFLKKNIYRQHVLSINLAGIGLIIIFGIFVFEIIKNNLKYNFLYDISLLIGSFFYSLNICFFTSLSNNYFKPFKFIFYIGIISTILTIIGYTILSLINNINLSYIINIFKCDKNNKICKDNYYLKIALIFTLFSFLKICIIHVLSYLSPSYLAISNIINSIIYRIIKRIQINSNDKIIIIFNSFGYFIILISALIFNDIIICNFWDLNKNFLEKMRERLLNERLKITGDNDYNIEYDNDNDDEFII